MNPTWPATWQALQAAVRTTSVASSVKAVVNAMILISAPSFEVVLETASTSPVDPGPFRLDLSYRLEALSIAKRDVAGAGKFQHASRMQDG